MRSEKEEDCQLQLTITMSIVLKENYRKVLSSQKSPFTFEPTGMQKKVMRCFHH